MPVKLLPAYDNIKFIFDDENILKVLDDVKFAKLLGQPLIEIKTMFPSDSSAFEPLIKTKLQIEAGDDSSYDRVCTMFTNVSREVYKVLCKELRGPSSCYILSTCLY